MNQNKGKQGILGICIPTYNGSQILKENIYNLIEYIREYSIPIYISDNCSTDDTVSVISELKAVYPHIVYSSNQENLGGDKNFEIVLKLCKEKYAWLMGDDDTICGDIDEIIKILQNEEPDMLVLTKSESIFDGMYTDKLQIFNDLSTQMTWMSSDIFSTNIINEFDFSRYADTNFIHVGVILDRVGIKDIVIYCLHNKYIKRMRPDYVAYDNKILDIYARGWTELVMRLPYYTYKEKLQYCKNRTRKSGMLNNKILLSLRGQGYFNKKTLKKYYPYIKLYNNSPHWVLFLVSVFPRFIASYLRKLYKLMIK